MPDLFFFPQNPSKAVEATIDSVGLLQCCNSVIVWFTVIPFPVQVSVVMVTSVSQPAPVIYS